MADKVVRDHDEFELELIDAGAENIEWEGGQISVTTNPETFEQCLKVFNTLPVQKSEISLVANDEKDIDDVQTAQKILKLIDLLEDDDDVDEVFTNANFSTMVMEKLSSV